MIYMKKNPPNLKTTFFFLGGQTENRLVFRGENLLLHPPQTKHMSPKKGPFQRERIVFQPLFFVSGDMEVFWWSNFRETCPSRRMLSPQSIEIE